MLLSLQGIRKSFGGVQALSNGNLEVSEGEVHLLMGENGAGKSTLMKIVAGMYRRDAGEMLWRGQPVSFTRPAEAAANGVAMVHQESLLAPHLNIAENIFLGRETDSKIGWVRRGSLVEQARRVISELGFQLDPETRVARLSPAGKQLVEICRAVALGSSLLIFDEPTSSLSETETKEVFRIVKELAGVGSGSFISPIAWTSFAPLAIVSRFAGWRTVHTGPLRSAQPGSAHSAYGRPFGERDISPRASASG